VVVRARVARGVVGVVVVVEEVPARDVVDVAVPVVVGRIAEGCDQVAAVENRIRAGLVIVAGGRRDPRVARVVVDVECAVAVAVIGAARARAVLG
jgi:hypothetical protein